MYFFEQNKTLDMEGIVLNQFNENNNLAQADYIAKVVDFDGTFYIESKDGKMLQTSNINNGDIVILKEKSQIIFHINSWTKAKITWPAKFVLIKTQNHNYKLNLLYGEYMEMSSLQSKNTQNIQVAVDDIVVSQGENSKPIDFQLVKQGKNHVIKNNGAKLIVTSDSKQTNVDKKQVLAIQGNDISLFDSFEKFAKAIKNKDLSQTFTLNDVSKPSESNTSLSWSEWSGSSIKALDVNEIMNISEETDSIANENNLSISDIISSDEQKVATVDQTKLLQTQLITSSLSQNLEQLTISFVQGKEREFARDFSNIEKRISTIAQSFGFGYISAKGTPVEKLTHLTISTKNLNTHISEKYLLPAKYFENLSKVSTWLSYLSTQTYGSDTESTTNDILKSIPSNIRL